MPIGTYSVDLTDVGRLRKMTDEFLGRGLALVRSRDIPPVDTEVQVSLHLPGGVRFPVNGRMLRAIGEKGFVVRIEAVTAARLADDVRALLSFAAPTPVDPLHSTSMHSSASDDPSDVVEPVKSAPSIEEVVLSKALPEGRPNLVGQILDDKYQVVRILGQGGMGEVYEAKHRYLEKSVALKVLLPELARNAAFVTRFLREARSVAGLMSPHTVTVHDFGVTDAGVLYFTMDLLDGVPLTQIISDQAPLPFARAAHIIIQACASLSEAHGQGLLHRDLKPDNLFVTRSPGGWDHVTLLDFGIAKLIEGGERLTVTGTICGTPHYLSPEQAQGNDLDERSDIYSLGVILYEMLCGVCPFEADNTVAVLMKQIQEVPPALTLAYPDLRIHHLVDDLLSSLLSKVPTERPPSAEALADRIRGVAARIGTSIPGENTRPARSEPLAVSAPPRRAEPARPASPVVPILPGPSHRGFPPWLATAIAGVSVLVVVLLWRPWAGDETTTRQPEAGPAAAAAALPGIAVDRRPAGPGPETFPAVAPPYWVKTPNPSNEDEGWEDEPDDDEEEPAIEGPPEERHYVRLSRRRTFCRHLVVLTVREWAVEDPTYNSVLTTIQAGPDSYPDALRSLYDDCLSDFTRRNISEDEVRCTLRAGSISEVESCGD